MLTVVYTIISYSVIFSGDKIDFDSNKNFKCLRYLYNDKDKKK